MGSVSNPQGSQQRGNQNPQYKGSQSSRRQNDSDLRDKRPRDHKSKDKSKDDKSHLDSVECYNCGGKGHYANTCTRPKKQKTENPNGIPVGSIDDHKLYAVDSAGKEKPLSKTPQ